MATPISLPTLQLVPPSPRLMDPIIDSSSRYQAQIYNSTSPGNNYSLQDNPIWQLSRRYAFLGADRGISYRTDSGTNKGFVNPIPNGGLEEALALASDMVKVPSRLNDYSVMSAADSAVSYSLQAADSAVSYSLQAANNYHA